MRVTAEELHALIHSMTKGERRRFVMQCGLTEGDKDYMRMYRMLAGMPVWNAAEFRRRFQPARQIPVVRHYLRNRLLDCLAGPEPVGARLLRAGKCLMERDMAGVAVRVVGGALADGDMLVQYQVQDLLLVQGVGSAAALLREQESILSRLLLRHRLRGLRMELPGEWGLIQLRTRAGVPDWFSDACAQAEAGLLDADTELRVLELRCLYGTEAQMPVLLARAARLETEDVRLRVRVAGLGLRCGLPPPDAVMQQTGWRMYALQAWIHAFHKGASLGPMPKIQGVSRGGVLRLCYLLALCHCYTGHAHAAQRALMRGIRLGDPVEELELPRRVLSLLLSVQSGEWNAAESTATALLRNELDAATHPLLSLLVRKMRSWARRGGVAWGRAVQVLDTVPAGPGDAAVLCCVDLDAVIRGHAAGESVIRVNLPWFVDDGYAAPEMEPLSPDEILLAPLYAGCTENPA